MVKNKKISKNTAAMLTLFTISLSMVGCTGKEISSLSDNTIKKTISIADTYVTKGKVDEINLVYQEDGLAGIITRFDAEEGTPLDAVEKKMTPTVFEDDFVSRDEWETALQPMYKTMKKFSTNSGVSRIGIDLETGNLVDSGVLYINLDNLNTDNLNDDEVKAYKELKSQNYDSIFICHREMFLVKKGLFKTKFDYVRTPISFDEEYLSKFSKDEQKAILENARQIGDDNVINNVKTLEHSSIIDTSTWGRFDFAGDIPAIKASYIKGEDTDDFVLDEITFEEGKSTKSNSQLNKEEVLKYMKNFEISDDLLKEGGFNISFRNNTGKNNVGVQTITYPKSK